MPPGEHGNADAKGQTSESWQANPGRLWRSPAHLPGRVGAGGQGPPAAASPPSEQGIQTALGQDPGNPASAGAGSPTTSGCLRTCSSNRTDWPRGTSSGAGSRPGGFGLAGAGKTRALGTIGNRLAQNLLPPNVTPASTGAGSSTANGCPGPAPSTAPGPRRAQS